MRRSSFIIGFLVLVILISLVVIKPAASEPLEVVAEGRDFATQVLRDPWDMKQYSDVSQYLNASNNYVSLDTVSVADGLFSAREITYPDAGFFTLFPGFTGALQIGKVGNIYPIPSSSFHCLYYAMKVSALTGIPKTSAYWYASEIMPGTWGKTTWINVTSTSWKLYKAEYLESMSEGGTEAWNSRSTWAGLKILPIYNSPATNPTFSIDWVRLTDCNPVNKSIAWSGSGSVTVYLRPDGTTRDIEVATSTAKPIVLDVQGIEPGTYTYYVKQGVSTLTTGSFTINAAPILTIKKPSMTSGEDFSKTAGNRWDMSDSTDAEDTYNCVTESWVDGLMIFDTVDRVAQKVECYSGIIPINNNDPIFYLNTPATIDPSQYRYLSYRMYSDGRAINGSVPTLYYQDVVNGMVARWGWALGPGGNTCKEVGKDLPFDVGWNTYSMDLHSGEYGLIRERDGSCPSANYWKDVGPITLARFDPNENQLGRTLHQELDWIKLTKMDQVQAGIPFTIILKANKPASSFTHLDYYYTTSLSNPMQNPAVAYIRSAYTGSFINFLPMVTNRYIDEYNPDAIHYSWDTRGVSLGNYYICVVADDGYNTVLYCSDAPVKVLP